MLATGGSLVHTCQLLLERGATGTIIVVCVLAAPEGIGHLKEAGLDLAISRPQSTRTSTNTPSSSPASAMPATASSAPLPSS